MNSFGDVVAFIALAASLLGAVGIIASAYKRRLWSKERIAELEVKKAEALAKMGSTDASLIEDRLRVLERIATDSDVRLAAQIENLREEREPA